MHPAPQLRGALRRAVPTVVVAFAAHALPAGRSPMAVEVAVQQAHRDASAALVQVEVPAWPLVLRAQRSWEALASQQQELQELSLAVQQAQALQVSLQRASLTALRVPHSVREPLAQLVSAREAPQPEPLLLERSV
jgi:hypothetical protein